MKKWALTFVIALVLIIGIGGCGENETPEGSSTLEPASVGSDSIASPEPTTTESETPSSPAPSEYVESTLESFHIAIASDELLSKYDSYHEYISDERIVRVIIWTDTNIKNFAFITVDSDVTGDNISFLAGDILFSVDELSREKPFVAEIMAPEILPINGISFLDENGVKRYFSINSDGRGVEEAPPYFLLEFENENSK